MYDLGLTGIKSFLACSPDVHRSVKFPRAFLLTVQYRRYYYLATAELLLFCCRGSATHVMSVACVLKRVSGFPSSAIGLHLQPSPIFPKVPSSRDFCNLKFPLSCF